MRNAPRPPSTRHAPRVMVIARMYFAFICEWPFPAIGESLELGIPHVPMSCVPLPTLQIPTTPRRHSERRATPRHAHGNIDLSEIFFNSKMAETKWPRGAASQQPTGATNLCARRVNGRGARSAAREDGLCRHRRVGATLVASPHCAAYRACASMICWATVSDFPNRGSTNHRTM